MNLTTYEDKSTAITKLKKLLAIEEKKKLSKKQNIKKTKLVEAITDFNNILLNFD